MKKSDFRRTALFALYLMLLVFSFLEYRLGYGEESSKILKVAILDSPNMPKKLWLWSRYEHAYLAGVETAALAAKNQGITLQYKTFFYGDKPLDILEQIPKVKAWQPDLVLGPHYSNQFLLLKNYFPDTLVLSSYASDPSIKKLPSNFYSIFPSDDDSINALTRFVLHRFPHQNIMMTVQADCKECVDMSTVFAGNLLKKSLKKNGHSRTIITQSNFIGANLDSIDVAKLTEKYKPNDIILLFPANYYIYETLMQRMAEFLKKPNLIFITDVDNWGIQGLDLSIPEGAVFDYQAYRVTPMLSRLNSTEDELLQFNHLFFERYNASTADSVSYMTFLTIKSALSALEQFPEKNTSLTMRQKVLMSFRQALAADPNWFCSEKYAVYQYTDKGEALVDTITLYPHTARS